MRDREHPFGSCRKEEGRHLHTKGSIFLGFSARGMCEQGLMIMGGDSFEGGRSTNDKIRQKHERIWKGGVNLGRGEVA